MNQVSINDIERIRRQDKSKFMDIRMDGGYTKMDDTDSHWPGRILIRNQFVPFAIMFLPKLSRHIHMVVTNGYNVVFIMFYWWFLCMMNIERTKGEFLPQMW